jgi:capsular exopolysaccharide synthesis family protein
MLQRRNSGTQIVGAYGAPTTGNDDHVDVPYGYGRPPATAGRSIAITQVLWRRKWLLLVCAIAALGSGLVYLSQTVPVYAASTQIYIQRRTSPLSMTDMTELTLTNYLLTQCDVIRSSTVLQQALDSAEIHRARSLEGVDSPVGLLKASVLATAGKNSDIITISAESQYAEDAAIFANSVRTAYVEYEKKMHVNSATEIVNALERERQREDTDFTQVANDMSEFKRANPTMSMEGARGSNILLETLETLANDLTTAQLDYMQSKVEYEAATADANNPTKIQFLMKLRGLNVGSDGSAVIRDQIQQLEFALADMKVAYGSEYPAAQQMERRLERLRAQVMDTDAKSVKDYLDTLKNLTETHKRKVEGLQGQFNIQQEAARDLNDKVAQYQKMQMRLNRDEKVLDYLNSQIKNFQIAVNNSDTGSNVTTLEVAKPNLVPVRPNRPQALAIATALGLMAGLAGALLLDWMDHRIRSGAEVESLLGLPILGTIPHMMGKRSPMERGQEIHMYPKSEVAESYRTIRTGIRFGVTDASSRTLLVTSPSPGDGKTTVASNLAIAIAQTGKRVLLVDGDCRRPMMHRVYGTKEDHGLASVLAGQSDLASAIHHSSTENLDILPCGPLPPNPAEMLNSETFTTLLREMSGQYDQVIVDSPPVAPVTDARILAAACDSTILVIRAEKTSRRVAEHARDALASVGAVVLGVVVNDAPRGRSGGSNYGHYHYGYGYGYTYGSKGRSKEIKAISVSTPA